MPTDSDFERIFETQYIRCGRHELRKQYKFSKKRQWKFDVAHLGAKVAVELDGGEWSKGRHVRPQGFIDDCEKLNAATLAGWVYLRFPRSTFDNDPTSAIADIDALIDMRLEQKRLERRFDDFLMEVSRSSNHLPQAGE